MKYTVINEWHFSPEACVLQLDNEKIVTSAKDGFRSYRIDGKLYKPVPMSNWNGKFIAIKSEESFIGKEVEFVKDMPNESR